MLPAFFPTLNVAARLWSFPENVPSLRFIPGEPTALVLMKTSVLFRVASLQRTLSQAAFGD